MTQLPLHISIAQTYLEHAEGMYYSSDPTDIYSVRSILFTAYLDLTTECTIRLHEHPKDVLVYTALLLAAEAGEI